MKLETGDGVDDGLLRHQHDPRGIEARLERAKCRRRDEHRVDHESTVVDQPLDNEPPFGDEQTKPFEPRRIADVAIGLEARVVLSTDFGNQSSSRWTDRRLRWLSMTCCPSRLLRNTLDSPQSTGWGTKRITSNASCASVLRIS